jgi:hypothetical protein
VLLTSSARRRTASHTASIPSPAMSSGGRGETGAQAKGSAPSPAAAKGDDPAVTAATYRVAVVSKPLAFDGKLRPRRLNNRPFHSPGGLALEGGAEQSTCAPGAHCLLRHRARAGRWRGGALSWVETHRVHIHKQMDDRRGHLAVIDLRVRVKNNGGGNMSSIVGKSQPGLIMIDPIISTRTRSVAKARFPVRRGHHRNEIERTIHTCRAPTPATLPTAQSLAQKPS